MRSSTPIKKGAGVCVVAHPWLMWTLNPLQVQYVEESNGGDMDKKAFSFATSTLKGHLLAGEERFRVQWRKDDSVW